MKCTACGSDNRSGVRFCENCGEKLSLQVEKVEAIQMQTCKACGAHNKPDFRFCENCGSSLNVEPARQSVPITKARLISCQNCGRENPPDYRFCESCGTPLAVQVKVTPSQPQKSSFRKWVWAGTGIAVMGLIGIAALITFRSLPISETPFQTTYQEPAQQPVYVPATFTSAPNPALPEATNTNTVEQPSQATSTAESQTEAQSSGQEQPPIEPPPPADPPKWSMEPYTPSSLCQNCGGGADTRDTDHDGLQNWVEEYVAQKFAPYYVFDANELWWRPCSNKLRKVTTDICINLPEYQTIPPINFIYQARPGTINGEPYILLVITVLYDIDYAHPEWISSLLWHFGDTESLELYIHCFGEDCNQVEKGYWMDGIQMNRHSKGYWDDASDFDMVDPFGNFPTDGTATHPVVYVSLGKHGVYPRIDVCNNMEVEGGLVEHCSVGWKGVPPLEGLPTNVGEINFQNMAAQDFINIVFPYEKIWDKYFDFCGGRIVPAYGGQGTAPFGLGSVFHIDPYLDALQDTEVPICAGSVGSKWYPFDVNDKNRQRPPFISPMQMQMSFTNNSNEAICMIKLGGSKPGDPVDQPSVFTTIDTEPLNINEIRSFNFMENQPSWLSFVSCENTVATVVNAGVFSCMENCSFSIQSGSPQQIQMAFTNNTTLPICMIKIGGSTLDDPVEKMVINSSYLQVGDTQVFTMKANSPRVFSFVTCEDKVIKEGILSCSGNCSFPIH
ncbi:MAG: zinc ribbon domain-containing protein [Anaerolineales bacterium]|nr:zinc ribbon domain-containing protein [Anaerolineales bacterium]